MARALSEIQADLDAAYAARRRILTSGQSKGADGASKNELSAKDLQGIIAGLEDEKARVNGTNAGISFTPTTGR